MKNPGHAFGMYTKWSAFAEVCAVRVLLKEDLCVTVVSGAYDLYESADIRVH